MIDDPKLKPCPFCGSAEARVEGVHCGGPIMTAVVCECSARGPRAFKGSDAAEQWNQRIEDADRTKLRKALVGLVGAEEPKELEAMEVAIRMLPCPDEDRAKTINAIHAIRDTAPQTT